MLATLLLLLAVPAAQADPIHSLEVVYADAFVRSAPDGSLPAIGTLGAGVRLPLRGERAGPGCRETWFEVAPEGFVCGDAVRPSTREPHLPDVVAVPMGKVLPYRYGFARRDGARLFVRPGEAALGEPARVLEPGFGLGLKHLVRVGGEYLWRTRGGRYVRNEELRMANPIDFAGLVIPKGERPDAGWLHAKTTAVLALPGDPRWRAIAELGTRTAVRIVEARTVGEEEWLHVSFAGVRASRRDPFVSEGWVPSSTVRRVRYATRPPEVGEKERWIDVDVSEQTVVAYDGDVPIWATLVSTGRSRHPTPRGVRRIRAKHVATTMDEEDPEADETPYALEDVPWVQYFAGGVAFHAAFWHAAFGYRVSHGCVNLAPNDARFLFSWTALPVPPGWTARFATDDERGSVVRVR